MPEIPEMSIFCESICSRRQSSEGPVLKSIRLSSRHENPGLDPPLFLLTSICNSICYHLNLVQSDQELCVIASSGQASTQVPHSMQSSMLTGTVLPSCISYTSTGHEMIHSPGPRHLSRFTVIETMQLYHVLQFILWAIYKISRIQLIYVLHIYTQPDLK